MQRRAAIICALRTPIGRFGGALATIRPDDLAAHVIKALIDRTGIDPHLIEDVYFGAANQAGEDNRNVARMASLLAGLPPSVPGSTVNRLCASGLDAINIAARMIESNHGDVFIAGGVESMTRAPYVLNKPEAPYARNQQLHDTAIGWRFINPRLSKIHPPYPMGETAENVARKYNISRADQDQFALGSQQKWAAAHARGAFNDEIVPVEIPQRKGDPFIFDTDEHPRPDTTLQRLAKLSPAFASDDQATVTAGNSSGINDGSAALLLVEEQRAKELNLTPLCFVGPSAAAGVDPAYMGIGPVVAIQKALQRADLNLHDINLIELNEAFAAQSIACARALQIPDEKLNVNGGAIALGHPLGCSGARIVTTLIHEMVRTDAHRGLASLCVGVGQGLATTFQRP